MIHTAVYKSTYSHYAEKNVAAIIVAAGSCLRMGGISKQRVLLEGMPVIAHTLTAFQTADHIAEIVLVARPEDGEFFHTLCKDYGFTKVSTITDGGSTRQQSVLCGLRCVDRRAKYVAIHDGARPLIRPAIIDGIINAARQYGAATAAVRVKDTVKIANEDGFIVETPDRSRLWNVQTPQVFEREFYNQAMADAVAKGLDFTDDCQLAEQQGQAVFLYEADYANIKITTPEDIAFAEGILKKRDD
jgi:2-C-methyl-D-erythritol 4-phosphate cytidylyltransferase